MRNIFVVNAIQVVTSENHPEGLMSTVSGFPKTFDSRNYNATEANPNGDEETALLRAKSAYHDQLSAFYNSDSRAMWAVTLEMANGRQVMQESFGKFPDMTPEPEPEE